MIFHFPFWFVNEKKREWFAISLHKTYRVLSQAKIDVLWQKIVNIADISWHPLFSQTNAPFGLIAKPGLIVQVVTRLLPIPIRIFVESVRPRELLSFRVLSFLGIEQRLTYQIESTLRGTYICYSVTLRGWLSPLLWWFIQPYSERVAIELAKISEQ